MFFVKPLRSLWFNQKVITSLVHLFFQFILLLVRVIYRIRMEKLFIYGLYLFLYYILNYRKSVVRKNIAIILLEGTSSEKLKIEKAYYRHLSDLFYETLWAYSASLEEIKSKIIFKDYDKIEQIYQSGENATLLLSHIGNWELFCQWAPLVNPHVNVVVLYTDVKAGVLNNYMQKLRQRTGALLISTKSMLELFRVQKTKNVCVNLFAIDQNPGAPFEQYWTNFFDQKVPVISGAEKFILSQKQKAYFIWVEKINDKYILELKDVNFDPTKPYDLTHHQLKLLEENIRVNPSLWLLSHNRFKHLITNK